MTTYKLLCYYQSIKYKTRLVHHPEMFAGDCYFNGHRCLVWHAVDDESVVLYFH